MERAKGLRAARRARRRDGVLLRARTSTPLCKSSAGQQELRYLHRPASLEDVFLKLTGRDLRD